MLVCCVPVPDVLRLMGSSTHPLYKLTDFLFMQWHGAIIIYTMQSCTNIYDAIIIQYIYILYCVYVCLTEASCIEGAYKHDEMKQISQSEKNNQLDVTNRIRSQVKSILHCILKVAKKMQ